MIKRYDRGQIWAIKTYIAKYDRVFNGEHMALILGVNDDNTLTVVPATSKINGENKILKHKDDDRIIYEDEIK
jgi:hypothetical protein